jgi:hypothetical protein
VSRNRVYLAAAAVAGIAALILGLVLANGRTSPQPVIAVETVSGASPQQVQAVVANSHEHHAGMVLLYTNTWQQAVGVMEDLSGVRSAADVSVLVSSSGLESIASDLPPAARVIDADGNQLRAGVTPGGPGLLVLLWACLLLLFAYLVTRVVVRLRTATVPPDTGPPTGPPGLGERSEPVTVLRPTAPIVPRRTAGSILARYLPPDPVARWEPQCPQCGAPPAAPATASGYECLSCGCRWRTSADPAEWPDVVLSHRRRHGGGPDLSN